MTDVQGEGGVDGQDQGFQQALTSSKLQSMASELFRLQLCRNDDHNLSQSAALKNL